MKNTETQLPHGIAWPIDLEWKYFAIDKSGIGYFYNSQPFSDNIYGSWSSKSRSCIKCGVFKSENWQTSLVYRS